MARISGQKRKMKTPENFDLNAPLPSPTASINPSSLSDWWGNFSTRFSGYTPDSLFKVSRKTFEYICGLVEEEMMTGKNYTDIKHEYLTLNDRVAIALRRLCTGESFEAVGNLFRVNISTAYQITWRFVEAIEKKGSHHLHWPKTEERITEIKSRFEGIRGLPNCCGAVDSTKILFCLSTDHAQRKIWCDQENNPCMILQAVVDPDMRFLDIIAGLPGCLSEPDALYEWSLSNLCDEGKRLSGKKLKLAETSEEIGEYIVGNGGFPLLPWLLTPYNEEKKLSDVQQDFNERHYATWKVAKMAFERLKETWQIIQGVLWTPDKLKLPRIIYACCVLHNIMIDQNDAFVMQDETFLQSDDNGPQTHQPRCKFLDKTTSIQRDNLALYLSAKPPPFSSNGGFESVNFLLTAKKDAGTKQKKLAFPGNSAGGSSQDGGTSSHNIEVASGVTLSPMVADSAQTGPAQADSMVTEVPPASSPVIEEITPDQTTISDLTVAEIAQTSRKRSPARNPKKRKTAAGESTSSFHFDEDNFGIFVRQFAEVGELCWKNLQQTKEESAQLKAQVEALQHLQQKEDESGKLKAQIAELQFAEAAKDAQILSLQTANQSMQQELAKLKADLSLSQQANQNLTANVKQLNDEKAAHLQMTKEVKESLDKIVADMEAHHHKWH